MTDELPIMIAAVIVSLMVMLAFAGRISAFMEKRPTLQVLALSFLILIGTVLLAEATGLHVPKGYIYFALAFSLGVELLNLRMRARRRRRAQR
jgi:predicted tellurium resistance membrane protein TerC